MNSAIASKSIRTQTEIGRLLARTGTSILLAIDEGNALLQCHVSSAVAAAMLAPLGGEAIGQFRPLPGGLVEIDAVVTLDVAGRMLAARESSLASKQHLH
jgi:hypothetical protein